MTAGSGQFSFQVTADVNNVVQALNQVEQRIVAVGAAAAKNLTIRLDLQKGQVATDAQREITALQARLHAQNIDIPIRVNVRDAEKDILNFKNTAEGALRGLFRGTGFGGGVPVGLGFGVGAAGIVAAGQATEAVTRTLIQGFQAGIQYNSMLENATLQFARFTGSAQGAQKILADLTKYADVTPFGTEETIKVGQELIRVTDGNVDRMQKLLSLAGALAVTNPYQGLEGASYAIRELLAGDTQSFADRFNVSRTLLQQLRREATSTDEFVKLAVSAAGGSEKEIAGLSQTFQGRLSTIQSFIAQLGQSLTAGFFAQMSDAAGEATKSIDEHGQAWKDTASGIGVASAAIVGYIASIVKELALMTGGLVNLPNFQQMGEEARKKQAVEDRQRVPVQQLPEYDANAKQIQSLKEQAQQAAGPLEDVDLALKQNAVSLQKIANESRTVTTTFNQQIRPLERQLELLQRPEWDRQRRIAQLDVGIAGATAAGLRAGPSPDVQGQVAARRVELDAATKLVEIENRRAEIAQQFIEATTRGKTALEQQAKTQGDFVHKLEEEHQVVQDVRARRIEGLREELTAAQEVRRERLDGLREEGRAAQETRANAVDALREQMRVQQEARRDSLDGLKDIHRQELESIADADRAFEQSHKRRVDAYQVQIEKLRERLDAEKQTGKTQAEQQLEGLDKTERERSRATSLADAVRAVREADTIKGRLDANRRLSELQHEQEVAKKREQLQDQIEKEKTAREERRAAIQDQINALERKAREDDRTYQQQREARQEQQQNTSRAFAEQERIADRAAHDQDRADALAVRQAESAAKEQDRAEARTLREEERTAREADKAEQAQIRAAETAAREADRAEQETIRAEQAKQRDISERATAQRDAITEQRQRAADERQARLAPLELARLANEERLLGAQNTSALARAEGDKTRLEASKAIEVAEGNILKANQDYIALGIKQQVEAIKDSEYDRLDALTRQKEQLDISRGILEEQKLTLQAQTAEINTQIGRLNLRQGTLRGENDKDTGAAPVEPTGDQPHQVKVSPLLRGALGLALGPQDAEAITASYEQFATNFFANFGKTWNDLSLQVSHILPDELVNGVALTLQGDESGPAAILAWGQKLWNAILNFFGIASPSTLAQTQLAGGIIDGTIIGLNEGQPKVIEAALAVFNAVGTIVAEAIVGEHGIVAVLRNGLNTMNVDLSTIGPSITENLIKPFATADIGGKVLQLKTDATNAWTGLSTDLTTKGDAILAALKSPFDGLINTFFPGFMQNLQTAGNNSGVSWINGWNAQNVGQAVATAFDNLFTGFFTTLQGWFNTSGINAAVSWINGYVQQFSGWVRSGGANLIQGVQGVVGQAQQGTAQVQQAAGQVFQGRNDPLPNLFGGNKDAGGSVFPGQWYKVQADEGFASFSQPGSVLSRGTMSRLGNGDLGGGSQPASITVNVNQGAVQVQTTGIDEHALGQKLGKQITHAIASVMDEAQRFSPNPAPRSLPGAD